MDGWYVLEASAPHRCRIPVPDSALPAAIAAGDALGGDYFRAWLSYCASFGQWFLRLWWTARPPQRLWEADRVAGRDNCLLAVGPVHEMVIEMRHTVDGYPHRYRIARRSAHDSSPRIVRFGLGHEVTARADEVFDLDAAAELFGAYYRARTVPNAEYVLRELYSPDVLTDFGAQTHVLTVAYDRFRPVLATVADGEFAQVLHECEAGAGFAVLGLSALPSGPEWAELDGAADPGTEEFVQAAGSGGRYLVEWRMWDGDNYRMFVIGHHATSPVESLKESMRQLDELGEELRTLRVSMDKTLDSINVPAIEWASIADFAEIKSAEFLYSDPTMESPHPLTEIGHAESKAAPPSVTETAEVELPHAPLPVIEPAEVGRVESAPALLPVIEVAEVGRVESAPALLPVIEVAEVGRVESAPALLPVTEVAEVGRVESAPAPLPVIEAVEVRYVESAPVLRPITDAVRVEYSDLTVGSFPAIEPAEVGRVESAPAPLPVTEVAEVGHVESAPAPLPVTEPAEVGRVESAPAPLPVIEAVEVRYVESAPVLRPITDAVRVEYSELTVDAFPAIEAAELGNSESAVASRPVSQAAEIGYSEPTTALCPIIDAAQIEYSATETPSNSAARQPGPIDEPLAPIIALPIAEVTEAPTRITPLPTDDTLITFDGHVQHVFPNEVFTAAEVDLLLVHYTRTGTLPELGYSYREITFDP